MLYKKTKVKSTNNSGVNKIRIFTIYSKKQHSVLKYFGVVKGSVCSAFIKKKILVGYKIKGYVTQTKISKKKNDNSFYYYFSNKICPKNKKIKKYFCYNHGPISKDITHKKYLFKFPVII